MDPVSSVPLTAMFAIPCKLPNVWVVEKVSNLLQSMASKNAKNVLISVPNVQMENAPNAEMGRT
jgi:hypothetical protein